MSYDLSIYQLGITGVSEHRFTVSRGTLLSVSLIYPLGQLCYTLGLGSGRVLRVFDVGGHRSLVCVFVLLL